MRNNVNAYASFFLIDLYDEDRRVIPLDTPFRTYNDYELHVVGFCNGILCFGNLIDSVEIVPQYHCNLVLGEYLKLLFLLCDQPDVHEVEAYGFGCDDRTGDYKVLSIFRKSGYEPLGGEAWVQRVDSKWRQVGWVQCLYASVEKSGDEALWERRFLGMC